MAFWLRLAVIALVLAIGLTAVYFSPLQPWLKDWKQAAAWVRNTVNDLGLWAYPICTLVSAILVACSVPRLLLCVIGGAAIGFLPGLVTTQLGTVIGYYAIFLFVRWGGRDIVHHRWPKLQHWADLISKQGSIGVILVRQLPIHGTLANLCLGLTHLKHRQFIIGTIIGLVPEAIPAALIGAGLARGSAQDAATYVAIAIGICAMIWIAYRIAMNRLRRNRETSAIMDEVSSLKGDDD
jgi:uncharacterized membrane protein YdjX (TVP38/TMEM64 family)